MPITHITKQGECLTTIARRYGFRDYRTIYDHPDNVAFKKMRPDPNVIFPGDRIVIPDKELKMAAAATGRVHTFKARSLGKVLRLKLLVHGNEPLANANYELDADNALFRGKTAADGLLEQRIPVGAQMGELRIDGRVLHLRFGALNPMRDVDDEGVSGAQARLHNLGFDAGPSDSIIGRRTRAALALFQAEVGVPISGEFDETTLAALERRYGC